MNREIDTGDGLAPLNGGRVSSEVSGTDVLARFHLLGNLRVASASGGDLLPKGQKVRGLLAYLAVANGDPVRRTRIAGLLWDRVTEEQARNSLRQALAELSSLFAICPGPVIEANREEIRLRAERVWIDVAALDTPGNRDVSRVLPVPRSGVLLDGLDGIGVSFDHWLAEERARTENRLRDLFQSRLDYLTDTKSAPELRIDAARGLLTFDPSDERAWRATIAASVEMGDRARALREYRRCEDTLRRLLDLAPSRETAELGALLRSGSTDTAAIAGPDRVPAAVSLMKKPAAETIPRACASIAVLPFAADGLAPGASWFGAALIDGIVHLLSGLGDLFVIGRASSAAYGPGPGAREAGAALQVDYVVTGSVRGAGDRLRVFVELSETSTGRVVGTRRLDARMTDLFELQDRLATDIVATIAPTVRARDLARARRQPPANLTAYELTLRAQDTIAQLSPETYGAAEGLLRRAMELDPDYAPAHAHAATWHGFRIGQGWSPDAAADAALAETHAIAALERDPDNAIALALRGQILSFTKRDYIGGRHFLNHAIAAGPSCALAWMLSSATLGWTGDGPGAIAHADRALKLSPFDPFAYFAMHMLSQGHYVAGQFAEAVAWGRKAAAGNGRLTSNLRTLVASLVALGDLPEARAAAARLLDIEPDFRVDNFIKRTAFGPPLRQPYAARLRVAGLPD